MIHTKEQILHNLIDKLPKKEILLRMCFLLITVVVLAGLSTEQVKAAAGLKIYDYKTKKTTTYTGKQVKVTYNGKAIGNSKTPGIIVDGIALLPFYDIFVNSKIGAEYKYEKAKGTVSISKAGKTIVMKIGSKAATVNGQAVTLPVAPMQIKYVAANKAKIIVPSRFVAETLGYQYTWYSNENTVAIIEKEQSGTSLRLSYDSGNMFEYTGAQGKVTVDGKAIDLEGMPSILTNNTAMLQAKKIFGGALGASYTFNSTKKTVTIAKNGNTLVMTIGSNKAILNKKEVKISTPPMLVKNYETNLTYVMVPGYFTAKSLGFGYTWNNTTRTSVITSPKTSSNNSDNNTNNNQTEPELGDSGVVNEQGTIVKEWLGNEALYGKSNQQHDLNNGISTVPGIGNIYLATRDYSNIKANSETFLIAATAPFSKVNTLQNGNKISIIAENLTSTEQSNLMYGEFSNYVNTITMTNLITGNGSQIDLELLSTEFQYDISYSPDHLILYITIYQNALTAATVGVNTAGDYITLTGIDPLKVTLSEQEEFLYMDIPNTSNGIGDLMGEITGTTYIKQVFIVNVADKTQIILVLNEGSEYYIMESGNQYTLSFQTPKDSEEPGEAEEPEDPQVPEEQLGTIGNSNIPPVSDKSKYQIVIPLPTGIATSSITHVDYYFNNYFVIRIPGKQKDFYQNNPITNQAKVVDKITITTTTNNVTEIKVATSKLQGYELACDSNNLYIRVGDPKDIYKNIVVLDPGHGGAANGAQYYGTKEKDVNFTILYTIGKKYFDSDPSKLKVYYTRTSDVDMTLSNRAAFVKTVGADLFVSLHMNAAVSSVSGTEVFYSNKNNAANKAGLTSQKLASYFVTNLTKSLGTKDRGVKQEMYTVIHKNTVPAVLIELGFLSNKEEHAKLTDSDYQNKAAKIIYDTIIQVFQEYPTGR